MKYKVGSGIFPSRCEQSRNIIVFISNHYLTEIHTSGWLRECAVTIHKVIIKWLQIGLKFDYNNYRNILVL